MFEDLKKTSMIKTQVINHMHIWSYEKTIFLNSKNNDMTTQPANLNKLSICKSKHKPKR